MSDEKQIEEMANDLLFAHREFSSGDGIYTDYRETARELIETGYHKQVEGEWIFEASCNCLEGTDAPLNYKCSLCGEYATDSWNYCPYCGAKMKGEEHE